MTATITSNALIAECPECEQLENKSSRAICRGEHGIERANRFRVKVWNIPPLETYAGSQVVKPSKATPQKPPTPRCHRGKPGNELTALLKSIGINAAWCETGCSGYSKQMNQWGIAGCRQRRAEIVQRLESEQRKAGWSVTAKAAAMSVINGIAFRIDLADPLGWLVDEAIRRAEQSQCECSPERTLP